MEKLNLVLILLLSFFVLDLYLGQHNQQGKTSHELTEHSNDLPIIASHKLQPETKNIHYLNYSKEGLRAFVNQNLLTFSCIPIQPITTSSQKNEALFSPISSFKQLDYEIPATHQGRRGSSFLEHASLYSRTHPYICLTTENIDLQIFPTQHLQVFSGYNGKRCQYPLKRSPNDNRLNTKASVYNN